jgi:hypothetical protein
MLEQSGWKDKVSFYLKLKDSKGITGEDSLKLEKQGMESGRCSSM